jgi:hypothetical protein
LLYDLYCIYYQYIISNALLAHKKRTKIGVVKILNYKEQYPKGVTQAIATSRLNEEVKTANKNHLDYLLKNGPY